MDFLRFATRYFQETTVHGFRYVVEGTNVLPKLLWTLAIITAFALAGVMVTSNLRDVAENPMVSSVETVPVQEIPFPGVTLSGAYVGHPFRLMQSVLNTAVFDCIGHRFHRFYAMQEYKASEACKNSTKHVSEPIDPFDYHKHEEQKQTPVDDCTFEYDYYDNVLESNCTGHSNLNLILESDECFDFGQQCLAETKEAWDDFYPAIEYVVFKTWDKLFYLHYISDSADSQAALDGVIESLICSTEGPGLTTPGESLITRIFDLVHAHVNFETDPSVDRNHKLIRLLASTFRRPLSQIIENIESYVEINHPTYEYILDLPECRNIVGIISAEKIAKMAAFIDAAAMVSRHFIREELRLGNLLLYAYASHDSIANFESLELLQSLQNLMDHYKQVLFPEYGSAISPVKLIRLLSPSYPDMFCKYNHTLIDRGWPIHEATACQYYHDASNLPPVDVIMRLMKYMVLPTSHVFTQKSEYSDSIKFRQLFARKNYVLSDMMMTHDDYSILSCKVNDAEMSNEGNCDIFSKRYTTDGIGYVFNVLPYWKMYKTTASNKAFYEQFVQRQDKSEESPPMKIEATGESFTLDFYIRHKAYDYRKGTTSKPQAIFLVLHDPAFVPNLKAEGIELQPGKYYEINVTPTVTTTVESGLEYDPEKRNCLTQHENDKLLVFNTYSQTACIFECQLRKALAYCNCTSWDYPKISQTADLCASIDAHKCFEFVMNKPMKPKYCDCLNDCDSIYYDTSLHIKNLENYEGEDRSRYYFQSYLRPFIYDVDYFNQLPSGETDIKGIFRERYDYNKALSRVKIKIKTSVATKIVRSARVTFSSQVANLGGIIGLFTGMSILSLAELAFWVLKYIRHTVVKSNCCKRT